jgi:hypothetical protein
LTTNFAYHPGQTTILYCNPSASVIWQLCDGQRTVEEITALLAESYPDSAGTIVADVESTLRRFAAYGAIEFR